MVNNKTFSVIIVGGGLAGLTSALHLSKKGISVLLIEKNAYPNHKVCGEYVSNEVLPYLKVLDFNPFDFGAKSIEELDLSTLGSRTIRSKLPLGGFGLSRYCMDWQLSKKAKQNGAQVLHSSVTEILFENNRFEVITRKKERFTSELLIGSFGKRSNLDVAFRRAFITKSSPFLGVKAHYTGDFPENTVGLHNFRGGYCGISKVENNAINVCYLTDYNSFKRHKNIHDFQKEVMSQNRFLKKVFDSCDMTFEKPLSISQVSFSSKSPVENHVLMCGDSAGMIHPLAGNGMSMAIRSAQMASLLILRYKAGAIKSRTELEREYAKNWNKEFSSRLKAGHLISRAFRLGFLSEGIMLALNIFPFILPLIIKKTHGNVMKATL